MSTDPENTREPKAPADEPVDEGQGPLAGAEGTAPLARTTDGAAGEGADDEEYASGDVMPTYKRFVYAAYFGVAMLVAFIMDRALSFGWYRLGQWRPELGEPRDEVVMPVAALIGGLVALYYWRNTTTRELAESVAQELSKVTWPTKTEVMNNTVVVIVTTTFATVFFALMDRFWGFVTNLVYGT